MRLSRLERVANVLTRYEGLVFGRKVMELTNDPKQSRLYTRIIHQLARLRSWLERKLFVLTRPTP